MKRRSDKFRERGLAFLRPQHAGVSEEVWRDLSEQGGKA